MSLPTSTRISPCTNQHAVYDDVTQPSIFKVAEKVALDVSTGKSTIATELSNESLQTMESVDETPSGATDSAQSNPKTTTTAKLSVSFSSIAIREYPRTIGDHPDVLMGPPVSLDWVYAELDEMSLDNYETERGPRRNFHQMRMHPNARQRMLLEVGVTKEEVDVATRMVNRVQKQRNRTVASHEIPLIETFELAAQSLRRKVKRKSWRSSSG